MENKTKQGTFFFDPEDPIYMDHFPGNPVVPGSLIVHAFMVACREDQSLKTNTVENFRFRQFISPGEYVYEITGVEGDSAKKQFTCKLFHEEKAIVTGTLQYGT